MAIVVTAKVLGAELGIARAVGAILFALVIGAIMHLLYRHEEAARAAKGSRGFTADDGHPLGDVALFSLMISILVFANWARAESPAWMLVTPGSGRSPLRSPSCWRRCWYAVGAGRYNRCWSWPGWSLQRLLRRMAGTGDGHRYRRADVAGQS